MNLFKRYIVFSLFISCVYFSGKSQTSISGIINRYTQVTAIHSKDSISVSDISGFAAGDTVLVIQMKGAAFDEASQAIMEMYGTGRYEFTVINRISANHVEFRSNLINYENYDVAESIQMIRVPSYDNAKVVAPLTCQAWDGTKGGILALMVNDTLTLNDSIYTNGKGYRGGAFTLNNGLCPTTKGLLYYPADKVDSAGLKGEGLVSNSFIYKRGRGGVINAGGGGYGKFSGGGGGGNYGSGGRGGKMKEYDPSCNDPNNVIAGSEGSGGKGDKILPYYFGFSDSEYKDRIFMGGAGGAGTGIQLGSGGGNGGGIVFIIARVLKPNDKYISSNGGDVTSAGVPNAGAGGGGAGGAVILSVDEVLGILNVSVKGGKGGEGYSTVNECWGQGGGGGGGVVWHSAESLTFNSLIKSGGVAGVPSGTCGNLAFDGEMGTTVNQFNAVLNGFLFNLISKSQSICYGAAPQMLTGSYPRGGDRDYKYQWQKMLKTASVWENIPGAKGKDYQPPAMYDTTYFRRVVKVFQPQWNDTVTDISKPLIINVVPEIKNNTIASDTAICYGLPQVKLSGNVPAGGVGGFTYLWETKEGASEWVSAAGVNNFLDYSNTSNTKTLYYRRKVFSTFCNTISNIDTIIVYPKITGNSISSSQTICYNYSPSKIEGALPSNGSGSYSYKWEGSVNDSSSWASVGVTTQSYAPPKLINKTYYRRIAYSGLNNTCKDTSTWVRISITPSVVGNTIQAAQTICESAVPAKFTGSQPTGGNNSYKYQWVKSTDKLSWDSVTTSSLLKDYQHTSLFDTTYFKRIVRSGLLDCCKDTSSDIKITVQPKIQNNIISAHQELCSGQTPSQLKQLSGVVSGGNKVSYAYSWETKTTGNWTNITGANLSAYQPSSLTATTYYRRKVVSGECTSYADSLKINVLAPITGNVLTGNNEVCRGLIPSEIIGGALSGGEPGVYRYQWQDSTSVSWNTINDAINGNYIPAAIPVKTYFRRVVKSGLNDCCISRSPAFEIRINERPLGTLATLDTAVCNGKDINLKLSATGNAPFSVLLSDQMEDYPVSNLISGSNAFSITPLNTATITIKSITDSKGCLAIFKNGEAKVRLVQVPVASPGSDADVCALSYTLKATPSVGIGTWRAVGSSVSFAPSVNDPNAVVTSQTYGKYDLYWKEANEFCSDSAKIALTFYEQPLPPVLSNDTLLNYKFEFSLIAPEPQVGTGSWFTTSPDAFIKSPDNPTTMVEKLMFGENKFTWTVTNGNCIPVSDSIRVFVDDILRYTGFSPNGDDVNEVFFIEGLENAKTKKIVIMNRWGGMVYSNNDYKNDWNGTNNNGELLIDDTYYYVLTVDGDRVYKGFVVLKR